MVIFVTASLDKETLTEMRRFAEVRYEPLQETGQLLAGPDLVAKLDGADIFVTEADPVRDQDMAAFSTLKAICSCRGNPVNVDIGAASRHGLLVINTPARNAEAVAELTIALMIMLARKIPAALSLTSRAPVSGSGDRLRAYFELKGHELWGKRVGLIGLGNVASRVAARLHAFEVDIAAFDPYATEQKFKELGVMRAGLDEVMAESDFVSIHAAVTDTSRRLIGARELSLMKSTAYFINTARSAVTDEAALVEVLRARQIAGAALDVFDQEPLPREHPLQKLDNVILLPHIGGNTFEVALHQGRILVADLLRLARGERPKNLLNGDVWASFPFKPAPGRAVAGEAQGERT